MATPNAVEKAVEVLRSVDRHGATGIGVSDLSRHTGFAKSTVFRLARTLEETGVLERVGDRYRVGELFGDPGGIPDSPTVERVQVVLTPFLAALYERSRQTVQLAVLDGTSVCFLNKLHGLHRVASPSRIGGRAPAYCTSLGKAMLAFRPDLVDEVCAAGLTSWTPRTATDPEHLRAELAAVRRSRIGTDDQEYVRGVASIASVVTDTEDRAVASLCVTGPWDEIVDARYGPLVLDVCARATRAYRRASTT